MRAADMIDLKSFHNMEHTYNIIYPKLSSSSNFILKPNIYIIGKMNDHYRQANGWWRILILMWHISTRL